MTENKERKDNGCSIPCNLCDSTTIDILSLKDRNRQYLRTIICKKCGLIWTDPRPDGSDIKKFYLRDYRKEYKGSYVPKPKHIYRHINEAVRRFGQLNAFLNRNDRILDIGSGTGVFVYMLRRIGIDASGLEPNERYAAFSTNELDIPVKNAFIQEVESNEAYNVITLHHVLEHMENPLSILKKIRMLLEEGGLLIMEVPNAENTYQDPHNRYHKAHLYTFNPKTIATLGRKSGFKLLKMQVEPQNGNIFLVLKKAAFSFPSTYEIPGNYHRIRSLLKRHSSFHHFTSPRPYKKFFILFGKAIQEQLAIRKYGAAKDILDDVIRKKAPALRRDGHR